MTAVLQSGTTSMSLDSIDIHPRIDDPSMPRPSVNGASSLNSEIGTEKCCQLPSRSINLISTITAPFSLIIAKTCFGVIEAVILLANFGNGGPSIRDQFSGREQSASATNPDCKLQ